MALQTLTRCALALTAMATAISRSALSSTKTWHSPLSCLSTGTVERSFTRRTNSSPPRGMIRST